MLKIIVKIKKTAMTMNSMLVVQRLLRFARLKDRALKALGEDSDIGG